MILATYLGPCSTVLARTACQVLNQGNFSLGQDVQNVSENNFPPLVLIRFKSLSGTFGI